MANKFAKMFEMNTSTATYWKLRGWESCLEDKYGANEIEW